MKRVLVLLVGLLILVFSASVTALAAGQGVLVQGEDFINQGEGEVEVIEGRIDAMGNTFRMWDYAGHWIEWKVNIPSDGTYKIVFRYAAGANPPQRKIEIDGKVLPGFDAHAFQLTGGWCKEENQWCNYVLRTAGKDALFELKAGSHVLRMTNTGEDQNGMNIDAIGFLAPDAKLDAFGPAAVAQE